MKDLRELAVQISGGRAFLAKGPKSKQKPSVCLLGYSIDSTEVSIVGVELIRVRIEIGQVGEVIVGKQGGRADLIRSFWPFCALDLLHS